MSADFEVRYELAFEQFLQGDEDLWFVVWRFPWINRDVTIGLNGTSFRYERCGGPGGPQDIAGGFPMMDDLGVYAVWLPGHVSPEGNITYVVATAEPVFDGLPFAVAPRRIPKTSPEWLIQLDALAYTAKCKALIANAKKGRNDSMWLTLLMALLTFLLTDDGTKEGRKRALLTAGVVGAGTALVTTQTEWGRDVNGSFNEAFGLDDSWTGLSGGSKGTDGATTTTPPQPTNGGSSSAEGIFSKLPEWTGLAGAGAVGLALGSTIPTWVWLVAGGLLIYKLLD